MKGHGKTTTATDSGGVDANRGELAAERVVGAGIR